MGFPLPQTFFKPFHSCSVFDQSQFSEANGVTSLQVSDDFASLSSLLNLLGKFPTLKSVFRVSHLSAALATAQPWDRARGWPAVAGPEVSPLLCSPRVVFTLL